jgi:hypothetical protein
VTRVAPQTVIAAYRAGQSIGTISRAWGISTSVVWKLLADSGEPRRSRSEALRRAPANAVRDAAVVAAYRAGQSLDAVARESGISKTRCWAILVREREPRRNQRR